MNTADPTAKAGCRASTTIFLWLYFTAHFPLKVQGSFKVRVHWCCGLCKYIVGHTEIIILTYIYLNLQKLCEKMQYFQRKLQAKLNTLKEPGTFKGKCVVNAEIFICNFLTGPLMKIILMVGGQSL